MASRDVAIFLRVASTPVLRLWAGRFSFPLDADDVETDGGTYSGAGELLDLPTVDQLINGKANRVTFTLSGVDDTILGLADTEADLVRGARVNLGFCRLDSDLQQDGAVRWVWEGEADVVECAQTAGPNAVRTVSLSVGTPTTDRRRAGLDTFTPADQFRRSPTDRGLEFVPKYTLGSTKKWA